MASDPNVPRLFTGQPRGFSKTHTNVFEPRLGATYQWNDKTVIRTSAGMFHNRVTLNDSTLLGGNVPFQPQVTISNGSADNPARRAASTRGNLPIGVTAQDLVFKHPTSYMWSGGVQREVPLGFVVDVAYVGRRGLYLQRERNLNQLPAGTLQANPGVNIAALRPYTGLRRHPSVGERRQVDLQLAADLGRPPLHQRLQVRLRLHAEQVDRQRHPTSATCCGTPTTTPLYQGDSNFDRRHVAAFYYIYDLPFFREQDTLLKNLLGGWQISGSTFLRSGTPFTVGQTAQDIAGVGDVGFGQPWSQTGAADVNHQLYDGTPGSVALDTSVFVRPANGTFGNSPRNAYYNPGEMQWDLALFKNFSVGGSRRVQLRAEAFNFLNHPNLGGIDSNPLSGNFGRITSKDGNRRDIQLSVRFQF